MKPLPDYSNFFQSLYDLDKKAFQEMKAIPCSKCGGKLDTANIPRKLRGKPEGMTIRFGLCCRKEGCRERIWPPSLRFLGRKVYSAWTIMLAIDFHQFLGLSPPIPRRTLVRWRNFWRDQLAENSPFIRRARAHGTLPIPQPGESPKGILEAFGFPNFKSWMPALKFFTRVTII